MVLGELVTRFGQMMRHGYAVMFDVTDAQRDELVRKQIRLVELPAGDRTAQLAVWVASLTGQAPSPTTAGDVMKGQAPVEGSVHPSRPDPQWNSAALCKLLSAAFSDGELTTLCFDHFRQVYEDFAAGMSKGDKIQRLLDHCIRYARVEELLVAVQKANPGQYRRCEGSLRG